MTLNIFENVLKAFYKVIYYTTPNFHYLYYQGAAESIGLRLTAHELAYHDKVLKAHVTVENEGRTIDADDIEEQDRLAELNKKKKSKNCCIS